MLVAVDSIGHSTNFNFFHHVFTMALMSFNNRNKWNGSVALGSNSQINDFVAFEHCVGHLGVGHGLIDRMEICAKLREVLQQKLHTALQPNEAWPGDLKKENRASVYP